VQYLNTRPLVHGLAAAGVEVVYDLPSRLADRLATRRLDVALIPSIELFRGGHRIVSDACIGCRGPVMSVKLFFRTLPSRVATLAVDEGSRTSAALARILLAERHGVRPQVEPLAIGAGLADTRADAVLLIGDRAIGDRAVGSGHGGLKSCAFQSMWDLGDEWCRWTGLPFVFAVWAARDGIDVGTLSARLSDHRGLQIHFAETHDNLRLAARSPRYARHRCPWVRRLASWSMSRERWRAQWSSW
jgi:chorismate dehydratase